MKRMPWNSADRQRYSDRNILKALARPSKRRPAPDASEWDYDDVDDEPDPDAWKHEQSCWIAFKSRGYNGSTVYWGPFPTYNALEQWALAQSLAVSAVELKAPDSDPSTWWYP